MWATSCGKRTLDGIEATLFAETLWDLIDEANLNADNDYILGVSGRLVHIKLILMKA